MKRDALTALICLLGLRLACHGQKVPGAALTTAAYRVALDRTPAGLEETLSIRTAWGWLPTLSAAPSIRITTPSGIARCAITSSEPILRGLLIRGSCGIGAFEQRLTTTEDDDVLEVSTRLAVNKGETINSMEDRYNFLPPRNTLIDDHTGPLDFVWSQNIKSEADDLIPSNAFKSPVVMMQQKRQFAALMPDLNDRHVEIRALDLDVTSGPTPWMAVGAIPSEPHGHSYFRRAPGAMLPMLADTVEYRYAILLSEQEPKLGYQRAVRLLWQSLGHPELLNSAGEQRNAVRPELHSFASWREDAWKTYADNVYKGFPCGSQQCGTLESNRSVVGDWAHTSSDAWFNPWFQTLRTAYGWYLHGRKINDLETQRKAESVLNLALQAPAREGAFSTIYLLPTRTWIPSDGWAGYKDSYSTFAMSWTAYWMLRWTQDLMPERKSEVLAFAERYGDFLVARQSVTGVIPSWFAAATLEPRSEFRDFNAETAPSALFLTTLYSATRDERYRVAAERAMAFVTREVVPRERWFDFETFLSCARKPYTFYDTWTGQFPQNNLAELQAPQAMLALYQATGQAKYLRHGVEMLDYVLLTQQVWNNPEFTPKVLGGFTTQNTDAEWSDARQAYAATLLADFYFATGTPEYLERAVAAARSTFAVAPWENWAHTGYRDEPGALTGFHWGTGSAMTSVEILHPLLGDALIDVDAALGVGFDECTIQDVGIRGNSISFQLTSPNLERTFLVRFRGLRAEQTYQVRWNQTHTVTATGRQLTASGLLLPPLVTTDPQAQSR